ncbi:MAG TPA: DUF4267 domain-containing protein [Phytomonospora sp.]
MSRTATAQTASATTASATPFATAIGEFHTSGTKGGANVDAKRESAATTGSVTARKPRRGITITSHILAAAGGLFIAYIGVMFLLSPQETFAGFGLPQGQVPFGDMTALLNVKGGRDIGLALITFILLATRQTRALGWTFIAMSVMPFIDMTIVFSYGGSAATALGVHGATAVYVLLVGVFIAWNERVRKTA